MIENKAREQRIRQKYIVKRTLREHTERYDMKNWKQKFMYLIASIWMADVVMVGITFYCSITIRDRNRIIFYRSRYSIVFTFKSRRYNIDWKVLVKMRKPKSKN